jgi:hypothetical protein
MAREDLARPDLLARVNTALEDAKRSGPVDQGSLDLDREVVALIREARECDSLLEALDLESLAVLLERCVERLAEGGEPLDPGAREVTWHLLDLLRRPAFLRRVAAAGVIELWAQRILSAVEESHLTLGELFRQRAEVYATKVLFTPSGRLGSRSYRRIGSRWHYSISPV